jgi:hypothetical protein
VQTSLCLEVGKGRNGGAHITVLGSGKRGEISEHISLGLEAGCKKDKGNISRREVKKGRCKLNSMVY